MLMAPHRARLLFQNTTILKHDAAVPDFADPVPDFAELQLTRARARRAR